MLDTDQGGRAWRGMQRDLLLGMLGELDGALLLVPAGLPIPIAGTDQFHAYRCHDDFRWLVGRALSGAVLAIDPAQGAPELFVPVPDAIERLWHGAGPSLEKIAEQTGIAAVHPIGGLDAWLGERAERAAGLVGAVDLIERPMDYHVHPGHLEALDFRRRVVEPVRKWLHDARRVKHESELVAMRAAAAATAPGHEAAMRHGRPGMSERGLQVEIEAAFGRAGADGPAYGSIVAAGVRAAILHAHPEDVEIGREDLVLVDAGAEVQGYDCDVTRTFPASGKYEGRAKALYEAVLGIQTRAIEDAVAGGRFAALHEATLRRVAEALGTLGLVRGGPDELVETRVAHLFMPHGLGHLLGLGTHDVGATKTPPLPEGTLPVGRLRGDFALEPGVVCTIEPGIYFVDALLDDAAVRAEHARRIDFAEVSKWRSLGGVRIEDDIVVTDGAPEVLTREIPKAVAEVEAACGA